MFDICVFRLLPALFLVALLTLCSRDVVTAAPAAKPFERLTGCRYLPQKWNDGDSFHVTLRNGKEHIFRLYFVDTPEADATYAARSAEQAGYFRLSPAGAAAIGREATVFTRNALSKPFTVQTRWRTALGRSKLPRYYAVVTTADGRDLAELLVRNGLARIYGTRTPLPGGRDSRTHLAKLQVLETKARADRRGAWRRKS